MGYGTIENRLSKLEEQHAVKRREPKRVFRSCVLKGREEEGEAKAFSEPGDAPTVDDLHIRWVVCATRDDDLTSFKPWAKVSPYGRRGAEL